MQLGRFRVDPHSPISVNPEKYGIKIRKEKSINSLPGEFFRYDELNGKKFEELQKIHEKRLHKLSTLSQSINHYNRDPFSAKLMIYPLYDCLGSKQEVRKFFEENSHFFPRLERNYHSLFVGAQTNQKMKGNLHLCKISGFEKIPFVELADKLRDISKKGFRNLVIVGGEPLIRKDIFKILEYAKAQKFKKIIINTNARMLCNKDFCKLLSQYVDEIIVVSPSMDKTEYEDISGVSGSFSQAKEGLRNWKVLGKKARYYVKPKQLEKAEIS